MNKLFALLVALCLLLPLTGCGGSVKDLRVADWKPSTLYSDEDISAAIDTVSDHFKAHFKGCSLTNIRYPGDEAEAQFAHWAKQYDADQAIVLYSTFEVGPSGGDGSLNPNSTYTNWKWVLVRSANGDWEHKTHGYG